VTIKMSKICSSCHINKSLSHFHKYNKSKDGRQFYCKSCKKIWGQVNKHQINERVRYRYANDSTVRANKILRAAKQRIVNRACGARGGSESVGRATTDLLGCSKEQYIAWLKYTLPAASGGSEPEGRAGYTMADVGPNLHVDHVLPLVAFDKDTMYLANHWSNLQLLPKAENLSKGRKILSEHNDRQIHRLTAFAQEHPEYIDGVTNFSTLLAIICLQ
jgi:hypothetical protein